MQETGPPTRVPLTQTERIRLLYAVLALLVVLAVGAALVELAGADVVHAGIVGFGAAALATMAVNAVVHGFRRIVSTASPGMAKIARPRPPASGEPQPGSGRQLKGVDLRAARLIDVRLTAADLAEARLDRANLAHASLDLTLLTNACLADAVLQHASLNAADLRGADLRRADLTNAHLNGADLTDARLQGAILRDAQLQDARLQNADLRRVDFTGAMLAGATTDRADMRGLSPLPPQLSDEQRASAITDEPLTVASSIKEFGRDAGSRLKRG